MTGQIMERPTAVIKMLAIKKGERTEITALHDHDKHDRKAEDGEGIRDADAPTPAFRGPHTRSAIQSRETQRNQKDSYDGVV